MLGLGLVLEGYDLGFDLSHEPRGLGPGLDTHVRLVAGETHVFEMQYVMCDRNLKQLLYSTHHVYANACSMLSV